MSSVGKKPLRTVFISTYTFIYDGVRTNNSGPVNPLLNYFTALGDLTVYILEQPLPGTDFGEIVFRKFQGKKEVAHEIMKIPFYPRKNRTLKSNQTYISLKIRDLLSNFIVANQHIKKKVDLFIGVESINAGSGVVLKKLGYVDQVAYYIFDWAPDRYKNKAFNSLYLALDKFVSYHCDYTWNITYAIGDARLNLLGYDKDKISPQLYVPYSYDYNPENILADGEVDPELIVYSGGFISENGPQLLVEAFNLVTRKHPTAKLLLIGGGGMEGALREKVETYGIADRVRITGYIKEEREVIRLQQKAGIAVAPYPMVQGSRKPFGDVIKIRMYFACGLPVISTPVPPVTREIAAENLGTVTADDRPEAIADAVMEYLKNPQKIFATRKNVILKAKASNWHDNYTSTLQKMGFNGVVD